MKRVIVLLAITALASIFATVGCGHPPPPASIAAAEKVAGSASVKDAEALAPQVVAHARDLQQQANAAFDRGEIAIAGILGERAIVAFERAAVLARLARAEILATEAEKSTEEALERLRVLDAERERLEADIASIEQLILVIKDARPITPTPKGDESREAARLAIARSVVIDARLMCTAAKLLGRPLDGLGAAETEVARLEENLAQWPKPAPLDDSMRARSNCLALLTLARRTAPAALATDVVFTEVSQIPNMQPMLDDRGIAVSVQASTSNSEDAKARINAIAKVAANHPEFPVLVVRHNRSRAPKSTQDSIRDLAQSIAQTLESAGVSSSRIAQFDAGQYRPIVNDPLPPPPNSKNDRVEIVLVAPSQ